MVEGGRLKTQNDRTTLGERWSNEGLSREGNTQRLISLKRARRTPSYRRVLHTLERNMVITAQVTWVHPGDHSAHCYQSIQVGGQVHFEQVSNHPLS